MPHRLRLEIALNSRNSVKVLINLVFSFKLYFVIVPEVARGRQLEKPISLPHVRVISCVMAPMARDALRVASS